MLDAIWFGHGVIKQLVEFQEKIVAEIGKEKMEVPFYAPPEEMVAEIEEYGAQKLKDALMDANSWSAKKTLLRLKLKSLKYSWRNILIMLKTLLISPKSWLRKSFAALSL